MEYELAIIGSGPAGFSAAIYAVRAGIKTVVFDKGIGGGLANVSPKIENYPGFESISGMDLMEKMKKHANKYADFKFNEEVKAIEKSENEFILGVQSISCSAIYFLLALEMKKLAACWYCAPLFAKEIIKETLQLPETYVPMAFFTVGYPLKAVKVPPRIELKNIIFKFEANEGEK